MPRDKQVCKREVVGLGSWDPPRRTAAAKDFGAASVDVMVEHKYVAMTTPTVPATCHHNNWANWTKKMEKLMATTLISQDKAPPVESVHAFFFTFPPMLFHDAMRGAPTSQLMAERIFFLNIYIFIYLMLL